MGTLSELAPVLAKAFNDQNFDDYVTYYTEDCEYIDIPTGARCEGRQELVAMLQLFDNMLPAAQMEIVTNRANGAHATWEWVLTATLGGDVPGVKQPLRKGSDIKVQGLSIVEFSEEGLVAKQRDYWDFATALRQAGAEF